MSHILVTATYEVLHMQKIKMAMEAVALFIAFMNLLVLLESSGLAPTLHL